MDIVRDSLDLIGNTPLLLVKNLDTGPCNLYLKLESFNLGGSIKDRPAKNMIIEAEKKGLLRKGGTIVEATAGNTGIALAIMAVKRGYKVVIIVPDKMTIEKVYHDKEERVFITISRGKSSNIKDLWDVHFLYYNEKNKIYKIEERIDTLHLAEGNIGPRV